MRREYKLAATPTYPRMGPAVREILEHAGGERRVFLVVQDGPDAVNVLKAIRCAYQDGRDDLHAEDIEAAERADIHGPECEDEALPVAAENSTPEEQQS